MENFAGSTIKGYDLINLIDAGSFGAVYLAQQQVIGREVALKILWPVLASRPDFIRRFETEAQLVAGLEHPHIVPLYDYWRDPEGAYIVMRLLRGGTLRTQITNAALDTDTVLTLFNQIATALTFAHRYGIVHRDIKPENILLDEEGNAYLADFGIAQIVRSSHDFGDDVDAFGSIAYAAPEQFANKPITPLADQYSLAILLYEILAGGHPFPDLDRMTPRQIVRTKTTQIITPLTDTKPELPRAIDDVLLRATQTEPEERYADIATFLNAVEFAFKRTTKTGTHPIVRIPTETMGDREIRHRTSLLEFDDIPNPYKGLQTFLEADASNFFGRDDLVGKLIQRLKQAHEFSNFLAVVGPSGSGKSSVVKAGLVPALRRGALDHSAFWYYVEMVPGQRPFKELEAALVSISPTPQVDLARRLRNDAGLLHVIVNKILPNDAKSKLFLVIDQFEEVFTLVEDEAETAAFISALFEAIIAKDSQLIVLITLRADFYDRPLLRPLISDMMSQRTEVVVPLNTTELEQAITLPAQRAGAILEPGLVNAIINEIKGQPAILPLLQYLMRELFERRDGNLLTSRAYTQMGGVRGALARQADNLYQAFNDQEKAALRQILLRLITLGEGVQDTRRRASLTEVNSLATHDPQAARHVIDTLSKSRLLTFDRDPESFQPTVEITHEAIIREWAQLKAWIDASREDLRIQRNLGRLASEWLNAARDSSYLLLGARLRQFQTWAEQSDVELNTDERQFLNESIAEQQRRTTLEIERRQQQERLEIRARNRLRFLVVILAVAVVLSSLLAIFATNEGSRARRESAIALSLVQDASAREALQNGDSDLALILALEANAIPEAPPRAGRTLEEVAFAPGTRTILEGHTSAVTGVDISADGRLIASSSQDATVRLWDIGTGEVVGTLRGHRADVETVAFNPDNSQLVTGSLDFNAILWDVASQEQILTLSGHDEVILSAAFSPDGEQVATASRDGTVKIWEVATGRQVQQFDVGLVSVLSVAFSPDSTTILAGMGNGDINLWDSASGALLRAFTGHDTTVNEVRFSRDGRQAISGSADETIIVWDVATGEIIRRLDQLSGAITSVAYGDTEETRVIAGTNDGVLHILDISTGREINTIMGHAQEITSLAMSNDGRTAATGSIDFTIRLWNIADPSQLPTGLTHEQRVTGAGYDGDTLVTASLDGTVFLWDDARPTPIETITREENIRTLAVGASGTAYVGLSNGAIQHWRLTPQEMIATFPVHDAPVISIDQQDNAVVSTDQGGGVVIWEPATGAVINAVAFDNAILSASLSPSGEWVAFGRGNDVVIWDVGTNTEAARLVGHGDAVRYVTFSPDGQSLLSSGRDQTIILWDVEAGVEQRRLTGHTDFVHKIVYGADGSIALSGANNGEMFLWDVESGEVLKQFVGNSAPILNVALSPDGTTAIAGYADGHIERWQIFSLESLQDWVFENRYVREFTCVERVLYRISPLCDELR